jgi:hypothetical protein
MIAKRGPRPPPPPPEKKRRRKRPGRKRKPVPPPQPKHDATPARKQTVLLAVGLGATMSSVATALGIDEKTLRKHYGEVIATAREKLETSILQKLGAIAMAGRGDRTALIYLTKARLNWRDSGPIPEQLPPVPAAPAAGSTAAPDPNDALRAYKRLIDGG